MNQERQIAHLLDLLYEARRLNNQTVRSSKHVDDWHKAVDKVLRESDNPLLISPDEEWAAPKNAKHRRQVKEIWSKF